MTRRKQPILEAALAYTRISGEIARRYVRERSGALTVKELQLLIQLRRELHTHHRLVNELIQIVSEKQNELLESLANKLSSADGNSPIGET